MTIQTPAGQSSTTGYGYDPASKRLRTVTVNGLTITYTYLPNSDQLQSVQVGNVTTTFTPYASNGSLLGGMNVTASGQGVYGASYTYNANDQRATDAVTTTTVDDAGNTAPEDASRTYTYDPNQADALTTVQDGSGATIETYGSDAAGNLVNDNGNTQTPNNVNQLSGYAFNGRGDVTSTANCNLTWDALDRPVAITPKNPVVGSFQIQLGYDSQNRWLWKDVYQWNGGGWVFAYTREAIWDGSNLVAVTDGSGNLVQQYTWGPNGLALITDYSTGTAREYVPIADASGNTALLIDAQSSAIVASYTYDAYGNLLSASGPAAGLCPFLGKGLYVHSEVPGLMFAQNRVTDGRIWLSRDPSGESGGLNVYQLYAGDPVNNEDPTGLEPTAATPPLVRKRLGTATAADDAPMIAKITAQEKAKAAAGNYVFVGIYDLIIVGADDKERGHHTFGDADAQYIRGAQRGADGQLAETAGYESAKRILQKYAAQQRAPVQDLGNGSLRVGLQDSTVVTLDKYDDGTRGILTITRQAEAPVVVKFVNSGPVVFVAPRGTTPAQLAQFKKYVEMANTSLQAGKLSPTGRVPTIGALSEQAQAAAEAERRANPTLYRPYPQGAVGHVPDTTWVGRPVPPNWLDLDPIVNASLAGQSRRYAVGYKPTEFKLEAPTTMPGVQP